jgi:hypothetical protein
MENRLWRMMRLSPWDYAVNGGPEWCQGKATAMVSKAKDGDESGDRRMSRSPWNFAAAIL